MYEEPDEEPLEESASPTSRAREKSDEFRMHAELAAVFEAHRKFDAEIRTDLDPSKARDLQRAIGKLEKSKDSAHPILPDASSASAAEVLNFPSAHELSLNDYHISRRPGEVMIFRWLSGGQVDTYYERLQAHFDAAMDGYKEDEKQAKAWKQDPQTTAFLTALDELEVKMSERYLRDLIRGANIFVLSTQSADEINIAYLADHVMGVSPEELVGRTSAPGDNPSESELAWFYKLFSLRGMREGVEQMCFFMFLQKTDAPMEDDLP